MIHYCYLEKYSMSEKSKAIKKEAGELFKTPEYGHDPDGYLYHNSKKVMVQIGSTLYALKEWVTIPKANKNGFKQLDVILDKFGVRLLKDKEDMERCYGQLPPVKTGGLRGNSQRKS